jgi:hypothetical protein
VSPGTPSPPLLSFPWAFTVNVPGEVLDEPVCLSGLVRMSEVAKRASVGEAVGKASSSGNPCGLLLNPKVSSSAGRRASAAGTAAHGQKVMEP